MKKLFLLFILTLLLSSAFSSTEDIFFINQMQITGNVSSNTLFFSGSGSVLNGNNVKVYLLGPINNLYIDSFTLNGQVKDFGFDNYGYFFIANSSNFTFSGSFKLLQLGQVSLNIVGPINHLSFSLTDGYVVGGNNHYSVLNDYFIIQRNEVASVLVEGDFHYKFEETNNFEYVLRFESLGDSLSSYNLRLLNGESVRSVSGAVDYAVTSNAVILELTGSSATIIIRGVFNSNSLRMPLTEGSHDVLIESEPEKKLSISTSSEVIDISDSSITPSYFNSQAFLADSADYFYTTISDLTLMPSLTFAVSRASNVVALNEKGTIIGEMTYSYANSGEEYILLEVPGTPLYASTNYNAVMITSENPGSVFLSIPKTNYGRLKLTYLDTTDTMFLFSSFKIPLTNSSMPISEMSTTVHLPLNYFVLWTIGSENFEGTELPDIVSIIVFLLISFVLSYFMFNDYKFVFKYTLIVLGVFMFSPALLIIAWIISAIYIVKKHLDKKNIKWSVIAGVIGLVILGLIVIVPVLYMFMEGSSTISYSGAGRGIAESAAPSFDNLASVGSGEGAISVPTETGVLPVDFEIPSIGKTVTLTTSLVTVEKPVSYTMILLDSNLKYIFVLLSLYLIAQLVINYRKTKKIKA